MEEENDPQEVSNPDEVSEPKTENAEDDELLKAQELAKNYKIRAEKAESEAKQLKNEPKEETTKEEPKDGLQLQDIRALQDVHDDDVDDVIDYAKFKGITVAEAKVSTAMQGILKAKVEERKTAEASNTGGSRGGTSKVTDEALVEQASKGNLPESDEEIARLMRIKSGK